MMIAYDFNYYDGYVYPSLSSLYDGGYDSIYIKEDKIVPDLWYVLLVGDDNDVLPFMYYMDRDELEEFVAEKVLEKNWCLEGDIEWEMDSLRSKNCA